MQAGFGHPSHANRTEDLVWRVPFPTMRITVTAAALGLLVLTGCSSPSPAGQDSNSRAQPTSTLAPATSASATSDVPTPDAGQKADYLAALEDIDPGLVANEDRAMTRAGRVCERIVKGADGGTMTLEKYTVEELSGGNATIDEAQAKQVIKAVKVWCRKS